MKSKENKKEMIQRHYHNHKKIKKHFEDASSIDVALILEANH